MAIYFRFSFQLCWSQLCSSLISGFLFLSDNNSGGKCEQQTATTSSPFLSTLNKEKVMIVQNKKWICKKFCQRLAVCNIGWSKRSTKNQIVDRTKNKRTKSVSLSVWPYFGQTLSFFSRLFWLVLVLVMFQLTSRSRSGNKSELKLQTFEEWVNPFKTTWQQITHQSMLVCLFVDMRRLASYFFWNVEFSFGNSKIHKIVSI